MQAPWKLICLILALVLFFIAGFMGFWTPAANEPWHGRFIAAGLFFWVLSNIVS
jgi:hypothetical protein